MIDLIALGCLAFGALHGWRRGTLLMVLAFAGLFAGYVGAFVLARPLGSVIAQNGVPALAAVPLGGIAGFVIFIMANKIITWRVERRRSQAIRAGATFSPVDHTIGAVLGAASSAAMVVLVAWGAVNLQRFSPGMPAVDRSLTGRAAVAVAQRAAGLVAGRAIGDRFSANLVSRLVANPTQAVPALNAALQNEGVQRLFTDPGLRTAIMSGNTEALSSSPAVRLLAGDSSFRAAARMFGLTDGSADPAQLAQNLASELGPTLRAVETARQSPRFQELLADGQLQQRLSNGDVQSLLRDPRLPQLLAEFRRALAR